MGWLCGLCVARRLAAVASIALHLCLPNNPALFVCTCSLWDFLLADNSELIKCNGEACVVDYVSAQCFSLM